MEKMINKCIEKICEKNNIYDEVSMVSTKFNTDRLYFANNYVIKIYPDQKEKYFFNENYIYETLSGFECIPKIIDSGEMFGNKYIVITKIDAIPIFSVWSTYSEKQRENVIKQIADILKKINLLKKGNNITGFKQYVESQFETNFYACDLDNDTKTSILKYYNNVFNKIENNEEAFLIYPDFHFSNFLVDRNNKVYVIDFEQLMLAPLDYQLSSICHMSNAPSIEAPKELNVNRADYLTILEYFKKYYSEMFNKDWEDRVRLYNLIYDLKAVKNKKCSYEILNKYMER